MQTFLPYRSFARTAAVLDDRRLGKQRVEVLQILRAIHRPGYGWRHHPVVRMWRGYEEALVSYGAAICAEWTRRGHPDTCLAQIVDELACIVDPPAPLRGRARVVARSQEELRKKGRLPPWLGRPSFHRSHKSSLLRKNPARYGRLFVGVPDDLPYVWPVEG